MFKAFMAFSAYLISSNRCAWFLCSTSLSSFVILTLVMILSFKSLVSFSITSLSDRSDLSAAVDTRLRPSYNRFSMVFNCLNPLCCRSIILSMAIFMQGGMLYHSSGLMIASTSEIFRLGVSFKTRVCRLFS